VRSSPVQPCKPSPLGGLGIEEEGVVGRRSSLGRRMSLWEAQWEGGSHLLVLRGGRGHGVFYYVFVGLGGFLCVTSQHTKEGSSRWLVKSQTNRLSFVKCLMEVKEDSSKSHDWWHSPIRSFRSPADYFTLTVKR
jgi:hypothetical protein